MCGGGKRDQNCLFSCLHFIHCRVLFPKHTLMQLLRMLLTVPLYMLGAELSLGFSESRDVWWCGSNCATEQQWTKHTALRDPCAHMLKRLFFRPGAPEVSRRCCLNSNTHIISWHQGMKQCTFLFLIQTQEGNVIKLTLTHMRALSETGGLKEHPTSKKEKLRKV